MKPTVIQSENDGNSPECRGPSGSTSARNMDFKNRNNNQNSSNPYMNMGEFVNFPSSFGLTPPRMDDIFQNMGMGSRFGRMRDPFDFGDEKRNPYDQFTRDDSDFFPEFGSLNSGRTRRRPVPQSRGQDDFFNDIQKQYGHLTPEGFGFSRIRQPPMSTPPNQDQYVPNPQYYARSPHNASEQHQRPQVSDASIQTEECPTESTVQTNVTVDANGNLHQHGLRNTVDLGQRSQPERSHSPRAQSAPPSDNPHNMNFASSASAGAYGPARPEYAKASPYVYATDPPPAGGYQYQAAGSQTTPQPNVPPTRTSFSQNRNQAGTTPRFETSSNEYHIPIHIEGHSEPIVNRGKPSPTPKAAQSPSEQSAFNFQRQQPQPQAFPPSQSQQPGPTPAQRHPPQQYQQSQPSQHTYAAGRPSPINIQQSPPPQPATCVVPDTPYTETCIIKIQDIQRDVQELMAKLEIFSGVKNDKEYMYFDEMLTRNLLKLDTIDTNGRDIIRSARKEAIKCIQQSINYLEARAEHNAKTMEIEAKKKLTQSIDDLNNSENNPKTCNNEGRQIENTKLPQEELVNRPESMELESPSGYLKTETNTKENFKPSEEIENDTNANPKNSLEASHQAEPETILVTETKPDGSTEPESQPTTEKKSEDSTGETENHAKSKKTKKVIKKVPKKDIPNEKPTEAESLVEKPTEENANKSSDDVTMKE